MGNNTVLSDGCVCPLCLLDLINSQVARVNTFAAPDGKGGFGN